MKIGICADNINLLNYNYNVFLLEKIDNINLIKVNDLRLENVFIKLNCDIFKDEPIIEKNIFFLKTLKCSNKGIILNINFANNVFKNVKQIEKIIMNYIIDQPIQLLIETNANFDSTLDDLSNIFLNSKEEVKKHIYVYFDTSHAYLSGFATNYFYGLLNFLVDFEKKIGLKKIKLLSLNDTNNKILSCDKINYINIDKGHVFKNKHVFRTYLQLIKYLNIPVVIKRNNDDEIALNNELLFIKSKYDTLSLQQFDLFCNSIKILLLNNYLTFMEDYYRIIGQTHYQKLIQNIKEKIIILSKNDSIIIKNNNNYKLNCELNGDYEFITNNINKLLNDYDYDIFFFKYSNNQDYKNIKNLIKNSFIKHETALKLVNNNVHSLKKINNMSIIDKKAILEKEEYAIVQKIVKNLKKQKKNDVDILLKLLKTSISDFDASVYDENNEEYIEFKILLISSNPTIFDEFKLVLENNFKIAHIIHENNTIISCLSYKIKYRNIYFLLNIELIKEKEYIYRKLFLTKSKQHIEKLKRIAKNKNFLLTKRNMFNNCSKEDVIIENEEDVYKFLLKK